jgi:hypothetical protein
MVAKEKPLARRRTAVKSQKEISAEAQDDKARYRHHQQTLRLVRAYVLIAVGVGLVVYSLFPPIHPAALTLGGAMVGFNPMLHAAADPVDA